MTTGSMTAAQRRTLSALLAAGGAASVIEVAEAAGVHVTTARFHLERLVADGLVAVRSEPVEADQRGRGRPRAQYVALTLPEGEAAGLSEAAQAVFEVSRALGFEPRLEVDDDDDDAQGHTAFTLTACPYRTATEEVPLELCRRHEELLQRTADLAVAGAASAARGKEEAPSSSPEVHLLPMVTSHTCALLVR